MRIKSDETEDVKQSVYQIGNRILNNLIYILKTKGSKRSINGLMNCYGIHPAMIQITQQGGPSLTNTGSNYLTTIQDYSIWFTGSTNYIQVPNIQHKSLQIKIKPSLLYTGSYSLLNLTGSQVFITYTANSLTASYVSSSEILSSSIGYIGKEYLTLALIHSQSIFQLYLGCNDITTNTYISSYATSSLISSKSWYDSSTILIGSGSYTNYTGNIQQFRLWSCSLNNQQFNYHMKTDRSLYLTDNKSIYNNLLTLYKFNVPSNVNILATCHDQKYDQSTTNAGQYKNFSNISTFPYNFKIVQHNTVTMNSYFTSANNKIRIRDNYLYDNVLYQDISNDIFNQVSQNPDRSTINMTISIPQIQNKLMYNINPALDLSQVYGDYRLKTITTLLPSLIQSIRVDIDLYRQQLNVQQSVIQYQKYFDKTIFKQVQKVIPSRCYLNKGIVYGNNDLIPLDIINTPAEIISINNNIETSKGIQYTITNVINNINNTITNIILTQTVINNISSNISNISNIYIYNNSVANVIIEDTYIQTINLYKTYNNYQTDSIVRYNVNYTKLVVNDLTDKPNITII